MVYIFGLVGFVMGFGVGLGVVNVFLRNYTIDELRANKSLWWTYGLAVWVFAGLGAWLGVIVFERYINF